MPCVLFRLRRILTDTNTEWNIAYNQLGFERNTASPLQSIDLRFITSVPRNR
jgi:hypothetical protein